MTAKEKRIAGLAIAIVAVLGVGLAVLRPNPAAGAEADKLAVVWTSGDPEVAHRVALMYTHAAAANGWFDEVRLIVWGPSARLLAADKDVEAKVKEMMDDGVILQACVVCADSYGVAGALRAMGIEVKGMGLPLTGLLKSDTEVITF